MRSSTGLCQWGMTFDRPLSTTIRPLRPPYREGGTDGRSVLGFYPLPLLASDGGRMNNINGLEGTSGRGSEGVREILTFRWGRMCKINDLAEVHVRL